MQDSSTPSPSDHNKDQDSSDSPPKPRLKLKRIVFENEEINTKNVQKVDPVPEAQAYEEPEEAPVPEEFRQMTGESDPESSAADEVPKIQIPGEDEVPVINPVADSDTPLPQNTDTAPPQAVTQAPAPPPVAKRQPLPGKPPASRVRLVSYFLAPVFLLAAIGFLVIKLFDPFGKELRSIQPQEQPVISDSIEESFTSTAEQEGNPTTGLAISNEFLETETGSQSIASYLETLQKHRLFISIEPKGLFVGNIFIPEGTVINPDLGLTLQSIESMPGESFAVLASKDGETFPLIINP